MPLDPELRALAEANHAKPAWRSASFWLMVGGVLCAAVVAALAVVKDSPTAAAISAGVAVLGAAIQTVRNSGDKRSDAQTAARKLEAAATAGAAAPPGDPAPVAPPVVCSTCGGSRQVYALGALGKVTGMRPCPNCTDAEAP